MVRRSGLRAIGSVAAIVLLYAFVPVPRDLELGGTMIVIVGLVAFFALMAIQLREIMASQHPILRAIEALALAVVVLLVTFAYLYLAMSSTSPGSFNESLGRIDAFYFAATTLTTTGFGDIAPVTGSGRITVTVQMAIDLLLVAGVIRLLADVARHSRKVSAAFDAADDD